MPVISVKYIDNPSDTNNISKDDIINAAITKVSNSIALYALSNFGIETTWEAKSDIRNMHLTCPRNPTYLPEAFKLLKEELINNETLLGKGIAIIDATKINKQPTNQTIVIALN